VEREKREKESEAIEGRGEVSDQPGGQKVKREKKEKIDKTANELPIPTAKLERGFWAGVTKGGMSGPATPPLDRKKRGGHRINGGGRGIGWPIILRQIRIGKQKSPKWKTGENIRALPWVKGGGGKFYPRRLRESG